MAARFGLGLGTTAALILLLSTSAAVAQTVVRGPYLQLNTPTSAIVRWRTDVPVASVLNYGTNVAAPNLVVSSPTLVTDHEVFVTNLQPKTRYYYSVGDGTSVLAGGTSDYFFTTSPLPGDPSPRRFWILGDSGTADANAAAVRDSYSTFNAGGSTDLMLLLGDNAYEDGTDQEYQDAFFAMYPDFLRQVPVWPTIGNHDRDGHDSGSQAGTWFEIFSLPVAGEAGGVSSGTEAYYSFDYGNVHFIVLDSFDTSRLPGSPMLAWLEADLAATTQDWIVAYWHHPPYSKGSHDSDDDNDEFELVQMRENVVPILESHGVDLVLAGHSHAYERSFLIEGHYGYSSSFSPSMQIDSGDGREDGDGPYIKAGPPGSPSQGAVYAVAGSAGKLSDKGDLDHPAMYISLRDHGSLVLDVIGNRLEGTFVDASAAVGDRFTIVKGADTFGPNILAATNPNNYLVELVFSEQLNELSAEMLANYSISGATIEQVILMPDGRTVRLALGSSLPAGLATIYVSNVTDAAGNPVQPGTEIQIDIQTTYTYSMSFKDGVSPSSGYAGTRDTYISEDDPDTTFNLATILSADGDDPQGSGLDKVSLVAWDLAQIPAGTTVESASMTLEVTNPSDEPYAFYASQRGWIESQATWNQAADGQPWSGPGASGVGDRGALVADPIIAPQTGTYSVPLNAAGVALVQSWVDGTVNNDGIIIADTASANRLEIASSDRSNQDIRPELVIDMSGTVGNEQPFVDVGPDVESLFPAPVNLDAFVADDGQPFPPGQLTLIWSQVSGPGTASFGQVDSAQTTVTFSAEGTYVLRLDVSDGELISGDELTVTTNSPGALGTLDISIAASEDDAEEAGDGVIVFNSTDLDITAAPGQDNYVVGLVFRNIGIPENATILDAWIQFQVDERSSGETTVLIDAEAADSSAGFADVSYDVSNRPRTLNSVEWSPPAWDDVGVAGPDQRTPGLESIVQEIVDRAGWASGNNMAFMISGQGDRVAEAFDAGVTGATPLLHIEYKETYENNAPTVSAGSDQRIEVGDTVLLDGSGSDDGWPYPPGVTTWAWSKVSGPGNVNFSDAGAQDTTATFSKAGVYVLRLTADDSELQTTDDVQIAVNPPNTAPIVDAGIDQTVTRPDPAVLDATASDDGWPNPPGVTVWTWSVVSGPGAVTFADANAINTSATFAAPGTYILRLTGDDSDLQTSDDVQITVIQPPNAAPVVDAGPDQVIELPNNALLNGTGSDDGWPSPPGVTTWAWSVVSGPGTVTLINANALDTAATFTTPGVYVLRLTGDDSELQTSDDLQITVNPSSNTPPSINAGPDQSITLPNAATLNVAASDDGLPNPPGITTWSWSVVSGPGSVTFADASAPDTSATFTDEGVYMLRLTGDDSEFQASDDVQVTVFMGNPNPSLALDIRIANSADDAEEIGDGTVILDSTDIDLIEDRGADQVVGLRFQNVTIPDGATIMDAWIQFQADEASSGAAALVIEAEAVDSAAVFTNADGDISDRSRTLNSVAWSPPAWDDVGDAGADQRTPNLASVVQEIIDRAGWSSGNDLAFIITGSGERVAEAYEGSASAAPLLHIDYEEAYQNVPPTVNAGANQSIGFGDVAILDGTGTDDGWPVPPGTTTWAWSVVTGPGTVTLTDANALDTTATFSDEGVYVLRLTGDDSELQTTDDLQVIVGSPPNSAPTVDAGIDQVVLLPAAASLNGSGSDDGLPNPPGATTWTWSVVSGPVGSGTVAFGDANALNTNVTFSKAGVYVLRLTGDDSELQAADDIEITVNSPTNAAPTVDAGIDQTVTLPNSAFLNGSGSDDGLPDPPGLTTWTWSAVSGPETVTLINANALDTAATFTTPGVYVLRLTGNDSELQATDDIVITVNPPPNTAPTVNAGIDQTVTFPDSAVLDGTGSDDGLPDPPAATTWTWSVVSGPDTATFADANAQDTSATFAFPGVYVLRLTGDDSELQASDDVQVTVDPPQNVAPVVDAGLDQSTTVNEEVTLAGTVSDDGWPNPPGATTWTWSLVSGDANDVSFVDASALNTTATFSQQGVYVLRLTGDDSELQTIDDVQITVANQPNLPPNVDAGPDQIILFPNNAVLDGTGSDDGKPSQPGLVAWSWSLVSGPDAVTFADANSLDTTASFAAPGVYVLSLTGDDGAAQASDDVQITVNIPPNEAPTVDAGSDQSIAFADTVTLDGSVTDDGWPDPPGTTTSTWSVVSGPGAVTFADAAVPDTSVTFSVDGVYVLRLTGDDSELQASDDVQITVNPPPNAAPAVDAGPDQTITLPNAVVLDGTGSDDGLPNPPGATTWTWSKVSGPGTVTLIDVNALDTTATFTTPGVYVLRLTGDDTELQSSDDVQVIVTPANSGPLVELNIGVVTPADDGEELGDGTIDLLSTDIDLVQDRGNDQVVGLRFQNVLIPAGATVLDAWIQFQTDEISSGAAELVIEAQAIDSAADFTNAPYNISSRARTLNSITWAPPAWDGVGEASLDQRTPNLAALLQEIISRDGWSSGNSVAFIITGTGERVAEAYDGMPAAAPLLQIDYVEALQNAPPAVDAGSDQTIGLTEAAVLDGAGSDDGLPNPPATTTWSWSVVSGPGTVTFADSNAQDTTATFTDAGIYVLRLTGDDSELQASDDMQVTVTVTMVDIDIDPSSAENIVHPHHNGDPQVLGGLNDVVSVVVLGSSTAVGDSIDFVATNIDPASVRFGPALGGIMPASTPDFSTDYDSDGLIDAKFDFLMGDTGIACTDVTATLEGELTGGVEAFKGTDSINTQDCTAECHN
jgi:hypothetical protein